MSGSKVVVAPPAEDDGKNFGTMMEALEWYFHVTSCNNHTPSERREAYMEARTAFVAFAYNGDESAALGEPQDETEEVLGEDDPAQNAPGSNKVH